MTLPCSTLDINVICKNIYRHYPLHIITQVYRLRSPDPCKCTDTAIIVSYIHESMNTAILTYISV